VSLYVLTEEDKAGLLSALSGSRHFASTKLLTAMTDEERDFYTQQMANADRLTSLLAKKQAFGVKEDETEEDE